MANSADHEGDQSPRAVQVRLRRLAVGAVCCRKFSEMMLPLQARLEARAAASRDHTDHEQQLQETLAQKHAAAEKRAVDSLKAKANRAARHAEFVRSKSAAATSQREQQAAQKEHNLMIRMQSAQEARETVLYERVRPCD